MDDWRHLPHDPREERAFCRNDSALGPRDCAFQPVNKPLQMRDLHHVRDGESGQYNDRGRKFIGDEKSCWERNRQGNRHTNIDTSRDWQFSQDLYDTFQRSSQESWIRYTHFQSSTLRVTYVTHVLQMLEASRDLRSSNRTPISAVFT